MYLDKFLPEHVSDQENVKLEGIVHVGELDVFGGFCITTMDPLSLYKDARTIPVVGSTQVVDEVLWRGWHALARGCQSAGWDQ